MSVEWWFYLTAIAVTLPGSLLGVYLTNRSLAMTADAIGHAVLPGIVVAYLLSSALSGWALTLGAIISGYSVYLLVHWLTKKLQLQNDAVLGIMFTFLFSLGVLLIAVFAGVNTDIDQECVLYGDLETSILYPLFQHSPALGNEVVWKEGTFLIVLIVLITSFFKTLKLSMFDPVFGGLLGFKTNRTEQYILLATTVFAVISFDSVGAVMVLGVLTLPAATARLYSKKIIHQFIYSACIGMLSCCIGVSIAIQLNISIAPTIVTTNFVILTMSVFIIQFKNKLSNVKSPI